ncbi:hypothetical protein BSK66_21165 [Paenibacillus odorifer]|jgi:hypothetical protein|uniref:Uncharacterized protein n=1 Tax=Paenibacillus odorifer TaxID=189426 RepID=A0A1R0X576_9BACL|nr:hypothetical protein PODO_07955 [Paenibacillus odorifer]ETT68930.1 hypothetical protein C171_00115 [Paenibacillus sp. FSL H8-237]OMD06507.1 hypothetical protein BJP47_12930 [Paenibacillus odorifer]OMD16764.1 hypothetical protein BJP50_17590 [Paenibacillus odorifer]OMD29446.1 hypothetical protein BJP51_22770 [Paenibacillus odorifer]
MLTGGARYQPRQGDRLQLSHEWGQGDNQGGTAILIVPELFRGVFLFLFFRYFVISGVNAEVKR